MTIRRQHSLPVPRALASAPVTDARRSMLSGLLVGSLLLAAAMLASTAAEAANLTAGPTRVMREGGTTYGGPDNRASELRRALTTGGELSRSSSIEPRRLSREQRAVLNQELREAMRNANRPRSVVER